MEFPEEILALIRQYSRPRVSQEALEDYRRLCETYGEQLDVKRKMVCPHVVDLVHTCNQTNDTIDELYVLYQEVPVMSRRYAEVRRNLQDQHELRRRILEELRIELYP